MIHRHSHLSPLQATEQQTALETLKPLSVYKAPIDPLVPPGQEMLCQHRTALLDDPVTTSKSCLEPSHPPLLALESNFRWPLST